MRDIVSSDIKDANKDGDYDLYVSYTTKYPSTDENDFFSFQYGNDRLTFTVCADDGQPVPVYIYLDAYSPGSFQFIVTTDGLLFQHLRSFINVIGGKEINEFLSKPTESTIIYTRIDEVPLPTIHYEIGVSSSLTCSGTRYTCEDPLFLCDVYWPIAGVPSPTPLYPPPPAVRKDANFASLRGFNPNQHLIPLTPSTTKWMSAVLMEQNNGNFILFSEVLLCMLLTFTLLTLCIYRKRSQLHVR